MFISYRHADNKETGRQWATWLHQALEGYEVPADLVDTPNLRGRPVPRSLYPVFRDEEELPADSDLSRNIERALEQSALLVVICSPRAVASRFVAEEIRYFKALGKADSILALLVDGEPNASVDPAKQADGLTAELECLPEPLRFGAARADGRIDWAVRTEPIAADVRPEGASVQGWTTGAAYREQLARDGTLDHRSVEEKARRYEGQLELAKLKIIAGALAVPLGTLTQRDKAMQLARARQRAKILRRWLAVVGLLAILALAGGFAAWQKQQEAVRERDDKEVARQAEATQRKLADDRQREAVKERDDKEMARRAEAEQRRLADDALVKTKQTLSQSDYFEACRHLGEDNIPLAIAYLARSLRSNPKNTPACTSLLALLTYNSHPRLLWSKTHAAVPRTVRVDSTRFAVGLADGSVPLFSLPQGTPVGFLLPAPSGEGRDSQRDDYGINDVAFSPGGGRLATVAQDNKVRVWDLATGKLLFTEEHPTRSAKYVPAIFAVRFQPQGKLLATAAIDGCGLVLDVEHGEMPKTWQKRLAGDFVGPNASVEFSRDGSMIAAATKQGLAVWKSDTAQELTTFDGDVLRVAFSHDGAKVVAACRDGAARVFNPKGGKTALESLRHFAPVANVLFSPDDSKILSVCEDGSAWLWNAENGEHASPRFGHSRSVSAAEFGKSGRFILTASADATAHLWDAQAGVTFLPATHLAPVLSAAFAGRDHLVLTGAADSRTRLWDFASNSALPVLFRGRAAPEILALSPDGTSLASASHDGRVTVWDLSTGQRRREFVLGSSASALDFSSDGRFLRVLKEGGSFTQCDLAPEGGKRTLWTLPSGVHASASANDHQSVFVVSEDGPLLRRDPESGATLRTYPLPQGRDVAGLSVSPDDAEIILSFSDKGVPIRLDLRNANPLAPLPEGEKASGFVYSRDGQFIAGTGGNTLFVWRRATGKLQTRIGSAGPSTCLCFSTDGTTLFAAQNRDQSGLGELWDAASGQKLRASFAHHDEVSDAAFSADGRWLLTASKDGYVRAWPWLPTSGDFPDWALHLATLVGGVELNDQGISVPVSEPLPEAVAEVEKLVAQAGQGDFAEWGRWFLKSGPTRPVGMNTTVTRADYVGTLLDAGTDADRADAEVAAFGDASLEQKIRR